MPTSRKITIERTVAQDFEIGYSVRDNHGAEIYDVTIDGFSVDGIDFDELNAEIDDPYNERETVEAITKYLQPELLESIQPDNYAGSAYMIWNGDDATDFVSF